MARGRYFVISHEGRWMIKFGGKQYGPYKTQKHAVNSAIDTAHKAGAGAQVFVQEAEDRFRTEWTQGQDPYPPKRIKAEKSAAASADEK